MENDPKPYKFMKESIKKQPPDWKKIVLLIAGWLALAALGGLVAAAVFAVTEPKIAEAVTREEPPAKVDIPGDEDPNSGQEPDETITASSASAWTLWSTAPMVPGPPSATTTTTTTPTL